MKNYLCLAFLLLVFACQQKQQNEYPTEIKSTDGLNINFEVCGDGDLTVLFVHGWCIDQSYWEPQVKALCQDYRTVVLDLPGHGKSGDQRDSWTVKQYAQDVLSVIQQLSLSNVVVVGHSMGGDVALEAGLMDDKNIVALVGVDNFKDVGVTFDEETMVEVNAFFDALRSDYKTMATAYAEGFLFHPSTDSAIVKRVVNDIANANQQMAIGSLENLMNYPELEPELLSRLTQKFYFINSNATPTNAAALTVTGVDFELLEIDSTGHYPMIEKPKEFNQLLVQILEKIRSNQEAI